MQCSLLWHTLTYYLYSCSVLLPGCTEVKTIQNEHLLMCSELQTTTSPSTTISKTTSPPTTVSKTTTSPRTSTVILQDDTPLDVVKTSPPTTVSKTTSPRTSTVILQDDTSLDVVKTTTSPPTTVSKTTSPPTTISQTRLRTKIKLTSNESSAQAFLLHFEKSEEKNYSWVVVLILFFVFSGILIFCIIKKHQGKNIVHPKQVYLIQKEKNKPFNTIENIQEDINKEKEKSNTLHEKNKKVLDKEAYKIFLNKKYPGVEFDLAHQFYKNKKMMQKIHTKLKRSKIKLKITEIPTEKADLETIIKMEKVKPSMKTIASMRVKNDKILQMMREKKIVKNNRFKK